MSIAACSRVPFTRAVKAGKLIRMAFERLLFNPDATLMCARLGAVMLQVVQTDAVHAFGYKEVGPGDLRLLNGFEFNQKKLSGKYFFARSEYRLDMESRACYLRSTPFTPDGVIRAPHRDQYYKKVNDHYILSYSGGPMALRVVHTDQLFPLPMKN